MFGFSFLFLSTVFVTCVFLLVLFWQHFWCVFCPSSINLLSALEKGGNRTIERKYPRIVTEILTCSPVKTPQSAIVLKGLDSFDTKSLDEENPAFFCQTYCYLTVLSSHHSSAQSPMQVPFCISLSFLCGLLFQKQICGSWYPPATCSTGQSAGLSCLCSDLSFSGQETLPLSILSDPAILPLDFIHNCFLLKYFLPGINWKKIIHWIPEHRSLASPYENILWHHSIKI